jgi:hypothetical protein
MTGISRTGALFGAVMLASCATGYQSPGLTGGVQATFQPDGTWLILAVGNGYTSVEAVRDFTYLKAAEVVKSEGALCFEVVGQYAAMEEESMPSQYGTMNFRKPDARLRIRIRADLKTCPDETNADAIIARLHDKVKDSRNYSRDGE